MKKLIALLIIVAASLVARGNDQLIIKLDSIKITDVKVDTLRRGSVMQISLRPKTVIQPKSVESKKESKGEVAGLIILAVVGGLGLIGIALTD